jgi:hypothetical protein
MLDAKAPASDMHKVVRFTNRTDFDFTSEMGAMYGGVPYFVPRGKSLLMPKPIAEHLATHLARQSFIQKAPIRDEKETDGKGTDRPLWDTVALEKRKQMFLSDEYEEEKPTPKSDAELMAEKIKQLNSTFDTEAKTEGEPQALTSPTTSDPVSATTSPYKDKAEVIAELKKRGIKFDARKNKVELEKLLS